MILTTEIVKEKVAEGDKFSTETQLIEKLGFPKAKGNTKKAQRKEIARYLTYEKTGKVNPKTRELPIT